MNMDTHEMKGAELASLLKSSICFKSSDGVKAPGSRLTDEQIQWWQDLKFGLFVHWGLYSLVGRGEWLMFNEKISAAEYAKLAGKFNPQTSPTHAKIDPPSGGCAARSTSGLFNAAHSGILWSTLDDPHHHLAERQDG